MLSREHIKKEFLTAEVSSNRSGVSEEDMKLINSYTRRELSPDEVYVFSAVLCDNDIDRDGERFTVESLCELEKLFVGKTGVIDHIASAKNQTARIFSCCTEAISGEKTCDGDDYFRLRARAYIPVNSGTADIIDAIDAGIIKEISVSCAVEKTVCSICGEEIGVCPHRAGEFYSGRLCCGELTNPLDAYEWSFVAVPSQKRAGVIKSYEYREIKSNMDEILKSIENGSGVTLSDSDCVELRNYISKLKQAAKDGVYYRDALSCEVIRLAAAVQPEVSRETMESVVRAMTVGQLREIRDAFEKQRNKSFLPVPQLYRAKENKNTSDDLNGQFKI